MALEATLQLLLIGTLDSKIAILVAGLAKSDKKTASTADKVNDRRKEYYGGSGVHSHCEILDLTYFQQCSSIMQPSLKQQCQFNH